MKNKFKPYNNKSLLVNILMSKEYKTIWNQYFIPKYNNTNNKDLDEVAILIWTCVYEKINIARLLLNNLNINSINYARVALPYATNTKLINLLKSYGAK